MSDKQTRQMVTFEYAGETWTIPAKMKFSEMEALQADFSDVTVIRTFLDEKQLSRFRALDLEEDEVDRFTDAMAKAKRLGSKGNSSASPASS